MPFPSDAWLRTTACIFAFGSTSTFVAAQAAQDPPAKPPAAVPTRPKLTRKEADAQLERAKKLQDEIPKMMVQGRSHEVMAATREIVSIRKAALGEDHPAYAAALNNLGRLLWAQGDLSNARPLIEQSLAIEKQILGDRHPDYAKSIDNLALLVKAQGNLVEAKKLFEESISIRREALGEKHVDYASALDNLGKVLLAQRDFAGARKLFQEAMAVRKESSGEFSTDYATSLINLALIEEYKGERTSAKHLLQQAIAIRGINDRGLEYANTLDDLASNLQELGDLDGARQLLERALSFRKESVGNRHADYATSLNNLGMLLWVQNNLEAARPLLEESLRIREEVLGKRHPAYLTSLNNLAVMLQSQGDLAAAKPLFEQTLALRKDVLGERSPDYGNSLTNMAELLRAQGDLVGAQPYYEQAVHTFELALGGHHPAYAISLSNLAGLLRARGDLDAARPLLERALEVRGQAQGESDSRYPATLTSLAALTHEQGDLVTADSLYEKAIAAYLKLHGKPEADVAAAVMGRARVLIDQGRLPDALALIEQARDIRLATLGRHHPDYAATLTTLAEVLLAQGKIDAAGAALEQVKDLRIPNVGVRSPSFAATLNALAEVSVARKNYGEARKFSEEALAIRRDYLDPRHPACAINLLNLSVIAQLAGDSQEAQAKLAESLELFETSVASTLPSLAERQRWAILKAHRLALDFELSIDAEKPELSDRVYQHVLAWKGLAGESAQAHRRMTEQADTRVLLTDLSAVRARLNGLYAKTPRITSAQLEKHLDAVHMLLLQRGKLETDLAKISNWVPANARASAVESVLKRSSAILIDLIRYSNQTPTLLGTSFQVEERYAAFVIRPGDKPLRIELGSARRIDQSAAAWLVKLQATDGDASEAAGEVRKRVWLPLAPYVKDATRIVVAADSDTASIPWAAIPGEAEGTFLIDRHTFLFTPSAHRFMSMGDSQSLQGVNSGIVLAAAVDPRKAEQSKEPEIATPFDSSAPSFPAVRRAPIDPSILLVGVAANAPIGTVELQRLFKAAKIDPIDSLTPGNVTRKTLSTELPRRSAAVLCTPIWYAPSKVWSGLANRSAFSGLESFESITHRQLTGYEPTLLSGIACSGYLSPVDPNSARAVEDRASLITAETLAQFRLSGMDVLVLPITSASDHHASQEITLQDALHAAGVRNLVTPLWPGEPASARDFLLGFVPKAITEKDVPEAFRQAQLGLSRQSKAEQTKPGESTKRTSPRAWARFVLSGSF